MDGATEKSVREGMETCAVEARADNADAIGACNNGAFNEVVACVAGVITKEKDEGTCCKALLRPCVRSSSAPNCVAAACILQHNISKCS